jgi:hypothetical protein
MGVEHTIEGELHVLGGKLPLGQRFAIGKLHRMPFNPPTEVNRKSERFRIEIPMGGKTRQQIVRIGVVGLSQRFINPALEGIADRIAGGNGINRIRIIGITEAEGVFFGRFLAAQGEVSAFQADDLRVFADGFGALWGGIGYSTAGGSWKGRFPRLDTPAARIRPLRSRSCRGIAGFVCLATPTPCHKKH